MKKVFVAMIMLALVGTLAVADGNWRNGTYTAESDGFSNGWRNFVRVVVENGFITDVTFDAYAEGGGMNKYLASLMGEYGMYENAGSQSPWWQQADLAAVELMVAQDPNVFSNNQSQVDGISGVSITIMPHFRLAAEALAGARR